MIVCLTGQMSSCSKRAVSVGHSMSTGVIGCHRVSLVHIKHVKQRDLGSLHSDILDKMILIITLISLSSGGISIM